MNQIIAEIGEDPFRIGVSFHADRKFAALLQGLPDLFADGLDLFGIAAGTNHEEVGKRCDFAQIKHANVEGLLSFGGSDGGEPGRGSGR